MQIVESLAAFDNLAYPKPVLALGKGIEKLGDETAREIRETPFIGREGSATARD